jgi:OOP family OmpA-OmpF porin
MPAPKVATATPPAAQAAAPAVVPALPAPAPSAPVAAAPVAAAPVAPAKPATSVAACPADAAATIKSGRIRFNTAKANVGISDRKALVRVIRALKSCGNVKFEIAGHTDSVGSAGYNAKLSKSRAEAIRALLVKRGIDAGRIRTAGYGLAKPVADNKTPAGRAQNRRIEFTVVE